MERREGISSFGDPIAQPLKLITAIKATYGILDDCETFTADGGSVTASNSEFVLQTGTSIGGYGTLWTAKPTVYVPGIGAEARATARFTTGIPLSLQAVGFFTAADGMFFGYNGADFGVMHRHSGEFEVRKITLTAAATGNETVTITLNGTAYTASVTSGTVQQNCHEIEEDLNAGAAGTLWNIQHIDDSVVFVFKGIGAKSGSYSISSTGTLDASAGVVQTTAGVDPDEDWATRSDWDYNPSWFNPLKGNLFKFEFAFLGYGPLRFYILNPNGNWDLVHTVSWQNNRQAANMRNPSLRVGWVSASLGSSGTNLSVYGASAGTYLQGKPPRGRSFSADGEQTSVTTEVQVLSIQCRREFGGRANNNLALPQIITMSTDSTKGAIFRLYKNATVAGTTNHQYVDENESMMLVDTDGTTVTGGKKVATFDVGGNGRTTIYAEDINTFLSSGDEFTITAEVTSGAASQMNAAIVWEEKV